ncbi:hypothetical protein AWENTII_007407 [Aspergillus wentii]|nr:hypothetical protein MW887_011381 [Aspergillus wentii]
MRLSTFFITAFGGFALAVPTCEGATASNSLSERIAKKIPEKAAKKKMSARRMRRREREFRYIKL